MIGKTLKMFVLSGAVLGGAGYLLFGSSFGSYLGTVAESVQEGVEQSIPVDFEIKRAESLIRAIEPQIENCKRDVARAEVELEELQESVADLQKLVETEEKRLRTGHALLRSDGVATARLAAVNGAERRMELELQRTLDSFRNNQSILRTKRSLIDRQTEAVAAAKLKLNTVRAERETLADQVVTLKMQQSAIEAMAASSRRFDFDDSALSQAKEALGKVQKRLDVAQKMLENDLVWHEGDPLAAAAPARDVLKEIEEQFAAPAGEVVVRVDAQPAAAEGSTR
ncbi:MAG: Chromosome partition protein Smc [Planctomycetota bacterium]|jgi:chromosome segregation ATPase